MNLARLRTYSPFPHGYGGHAIQWIFSHGGDYIAGRRPYSYGGSYSDGVFREHPDWFAFFSIPERFASLITNGRLSGSPSTIDALKRGERRGRWWWGYGNGWQICTTNPGTVQHAAEFIRAHFRQYPDARIVSVGANDGAGWCECPECTKLANSVDPPYTISERWWHWVNQVAREATKTHPDKWVESLAYSATSTPPRFPLEDNVAITKTIVLDSELKLAEDWTQVCKSVNLYSYPFGGHAMGFRHYPRAMKAFLKWGKEKLGALGHKPECAGNWTFDGPKYHYVQALQWDANTDVDALMDEFCALSYGRAAEPMRAFWDRHEQAWENRKPTPYGETGTRLLFYQWPSWTAAPYLMPNHEFECYRLADAEFLDRCMSEATRLTRKDGEAVQFRVARMADAWNHVRTALLSKLKYYDQPEVPSVTSPETMRQALERARELAGLRADRCLYLAKIRDYRQLNPKLKHKRGDAYTIFSHEHRFSQALVT